MLLKIEKTIHLEKVADEYTANRTAESGYELNHTSNYPLPLIQKVSFLPVCKFFHVLHHSC